MAKKMYVEGGKKTKTVAGVKASKKGSMGGSMARNAKSVCRVNNLPGRYVERPHSVG